jgi:nicotinamidase-related amidase
VAEPHFPVAPRDFTFAAGRVGLLAVGTLDVAALREVAVRVGSFDRSAVAGYVERVEQSVLPAIGRLAATVRAHGGPVLWARPTVRTEDGSDWPAGLRPRLAAAGLPFAAAAPGLSTSDGGSGPPPEDYVVPLGGLSPFRAGNAGAILRHCGVEHVIVAGLETNYEVVIAAVDAANGNFEATVAADACDAVASEDHEAALALHPFLYDVAPTSALIARLAGGSGPSQAA